MKKKLFILISVFALLGIPVIVKNPSLSIVNSEVVTESNFKEIKISEEDQIWDLVNQSRIFLAQNNREKALTELDKAWQIGENITDLELKYELLPKLIEEYLKVGAFDRAIALINDPQYENNNMDFSRSLKVRGSLKVTQTYLKSDQVDQSLEYALKLEPEYIRNQSLIEIIKYYGENNKFDEAINLISFLNKEEYSDDQYRAVTNLLEIYAQKNLYQEAFDFVEFFNANQTQGDLTNGVTSKLVELAIASQEFTIAEKSINLITNNNEFKVYHFRNLIDALIEKKDLVVAKDLIENTFILDQKNEYFNQFNWVKYFKVIGEENKVKNMIDQLLTENENTDSDEYYNRNNNRYIVAQDYISLGYLNQALDLLKLIPRRVLLPLEEYPDPKDESLDLIFTKAMETENLDLAKILIPELGKPEDQVTKWREITNFYKEKNQPSQAISSLNQALDIAQKIEHIYIIPERHLSWSEPNVNLLNLIAKDYYELGEKDQALKILEIAIESTKKFDNQFAFDMAMWTKSQGFMSIVYTYSHIDENQKALSMLPMVERETFKLLEEINTPNHAIDNLMGLIKLYDQFNQPEKSLEIFNKILEITENSDIDNWYIFTYFDVIKLALKMERNEIAIDLTNKVINSLDNVELTTDQEMVIYNYITQNYLQLNNLEEAEKFAFNGLDLIKKNVYFDQDSKIRDLQSLALSLITENSLDLALKILPYIETRFQRVKFLISIASHYHNENNFTMRDKTIDHALKILPTIYDEESYQQLEKEIKEIPLLSRGE
jgi:tetratricopeptide (TPR) repeat protein